MTMESAISPNFPHLTPDERIWRIGWFGECGYPGSVRRYAQPSIKVALYPIKRKSIDYNSLISPVDTDSKHPHETWVPISALSLVAIGDLWQSGRKIEALGYPVETFRHLHVDEKNACFVKAGLAIDRDFLLPLNTHPWHRHHTQSYCVAVSLEENHRLLVPCVELIRFYFGSSGNLLSRLFTKPLSKDSLWVNRRFNRQNGHLHIVLANRLSPMSASDIGRIALSKLAWRAAAGIYASCQKSTAQGLPAYPYTGFPFEGETDLSVSGIWLPLGKTENATFLVFQIHSCSYPFPFKSLSYETADRKIKRDAEKTDSRQGTTIEASKSTTTEVSETDPDKNKRQQTRFINRKHRFPDLVTKSVWREKIETMPAPEVFLRHSEGNLEQVAFGEPSENTGVTGIDIWLGENKAEAATQEKLPKFVLQGLKILATDPAYNSIGCAVKIVCPEGKTTPVFSLPTIIDEDGVIDSTRLFISSDGTTRQRRAVYVEVRDKDGGIRFLMMLEGETYRETLQIGDIHEMNFSKSLEVGELEENFWTLV